LYDDKCLQAQWLAERQYPQPKFEIVRQGPASWSSYPVVWKRPYGSAGKQVRLIQSAAEADPPCLLQEFCPDNPGDYRVTVIGDQVSVFGRQNRPNDFRASGSGRLFSAILDRKLATLCWQICRQANWGTMGFDVLRQQDRWVITEMSYTYQIYGITDWTQQCWQMPTAQLIPRQEHPVDTLLDWLLHPERSQTDQTKVGLAGLV
jgi:glutathione synthase/RimK-type ligase-like ATP-grasp enzyme